MFFWTELCQIEAALDQSLEFCRRQHVDSFAHEVVYFLVPESPQGCSRFVTINLLFRHFSSRTLESSRHRIDVFCEIMARSPHPSSAGSISCIDWQRLLPENLLLFTSLRASILPAIGCQRTWFTSSISLGRQVLSNHGSSGPYRRKRVFQPLPGMVCTQLFSLPAGALGPK